MARQQREEEEAEAMMKLGERARPYNSLNATGEVNKTREESDVYVQLFGWA